MTWLFGHAEKRLDKKAMVNFEIYDATGWTTIIIHMLSNNSRSKGNQTMKFGHLIEHNMRKFFLKKSYTKCGGKVSPRFFYKNQNWAYISRPTVWYVKSLYLLYILVKVYRNVY